MTRIDPTPEARLDDERRDGAPHRFGLVLLTAVAVPVAALFGVPQQALAPIGPLAVLVAVVGGAAAVGAATAVVLRAASTRPTATGPRVATIHWVAAALCFVALCVIAPASVLVAAHAWYGFTDLEPRTVLMAAVAGAALLLGAVFTVSGAALARMRGVRMRLAWAKVDLAAQLFSLGAVLATVAILY